MSSRAQRLPRKTLRIKCDRVTLCYFRFWKCAGVASQADRRKYDGSGPPPEMEALVVRMAHQQSAPARKERWTVAFRPACSVFLVFHVCSQPIFAGKWLTPLRVPTVPTVPR